VAVHASLLYGKYGPENARLRLAQSDTPEYLREFLQTVERNTTSDVEWETAFVDAARALCTKEGLALTQVPDSQVELSGARLVAFKINT
jgi:hypothetical protein